jgi:hypothetical protein
MSFNVSAHLQKNIPKQHSTISNQIVIHPPQAQQVATESASIQPVLQNYPSLETPTEIPKTLPSAPSDQDEKTAKFRSILLDILQDLFQNELSLLKNIIEPSKNIILKADDLYNLICILCDTQAV